MNRLILIISASISFLFFNVELFGQENTTNSDNLTAPAPIEQAPVSSNDLIRLATKAPTGEFSTPEEYNAAKEKWVKEYPDAYARIVGTKSAKAVLNIKEETSKPNSDDTLKEGEPRK